METTDKTQITVANTVNAPITKVWEYFSNPESITQWAFASDDWHAPHAENDLRTDGNFRTSMAAKDGSFSFDFEGTYTDVQEHKLIAYTIPDGRTVVIIFEDLGNTTSITETFDAETTHPIETQRTGWQAILDNFKKYAEAN